MAQIIVRFDEDEDRFINIFKAEKGIKSRSEAVKEIVKNYESYFKRERLKEELGTIVREHKEKYSKRKMSIDELKEMLDE
jgi:metal-responsive CopG/Arc/MetJ family transcriptional regulator